MVRRLEEELARRRRRRRLLLSRRGLQPEFVEQLSKENQTRDHAQGRREHEENEGFLVQWVVLFRRDVRQRDETEDFAQLEESVHSDQEFEKEAFDTLVIFQLVETRLELIVVE